ncbi:MAG: hypothetical protein AAF747_00805 [Planctomycetota bacterium]
MNDLGGTQNDQQHSGVPLLADFAAEADLTAAPKKQVPRRVVVGGLVLVGAAVGIGAMRLFGVGASSVLAAITVDYTPSDGSIQPVPEGVMEELDRSRVALQVPADSLTRDPFLLEAPEVTPDEPLVDDGSRAARLAAERARREAQEREQLEREAREQRFADARAAVDSMTLQGVMGGPIPLARIDGSIVRIGDEPTAGVRCVAISGRTVTFEFEGQRFSISMGDNE